MFTREYDSGKEDTLNVLKSVIEDMKGGKPKTPTQITIAKILDEVYEKVSVEVK